MKAVQLVRPTELVISDVPMPTPQAGEVLLRVTAAGICHTDLSIRDDRSGTFPPGHIIGHEICGIIEELGAGVSDWEKGEAAIVYPCWSCGTCSACVSGRQNACRGTGNRLAAPPTPGFSLNGGMAEYVAVPVTSLVAVNNLSPAVAAILPDAALVPYHSIQQVKALLGPGSAAVVIGLGGLGHLCVQMLRAVTDCRIIALDRDNRALDLVRDHVDLASQSDDLGLAERIVAYTGGSGADVIFDFVGVDATLSLAAHSVARYGAIQVPGLGCGTIPFDASPVTGVIPWGVTIVKPYSGTFNELSEVVGLARNGAIKPTIREYPFEEALTAFDDLEKGAVQGRAVLIMK